jgi:hypothetical protein
LIAGLIAYGAGNQQVKLAGFDDLAGLQAGGADAQTAVTPANASANRLEVGIPAALGQIVGVADTVTELRTFATDIANSGHFEKTSLRRHGAA